MDDEKWVVVRANHAGVHFGRLLSRSGDEVVLADARRVWSWRGARTLHEVATAGVSAGSRVSVAVAEIVVLGVCEVITCTDAGIASLREATWE